MGCGLNNVTHEVFFTKNGRVLAQPAFVDPSKDGGPTELHPTVCLSSKGEKVLLNLGQLPFLWDFDLGNTESEEIAPLAQYEEVPLKGAPSKGGDYAIAHRALLAQHKLDCPSSTTNAHRTVS